MASREVYSIDQLNSILPEKPEHEKLVSSESFHALGLELADELLSAVVGVHSGDQGKEGLGIGGHEDVAGLTLLPDGLTGTAFAAAVGISIVIAVRAQVTQGEGEGGSELEDSEDSERGGEGAGGGRHQWDGEGSVVHHCGGGASARRREEDTVCSHQESQVDEQNRQVVGVHDDGDCMGEAYLCSQAYQVTYSIIKIGNMIG